VTKQHPANENETIETKAAARIRPNGFRISGIYGEIWWIRWG